jgi:E3 ubiquitin-protein ligase TRIP12
MLEKLQIIQCIDVAEQALTALEILSRRNSKQILHSNGISACLTFIDFFSIGAQRNALQITANCCQNMIKEEFIHIQSSLPILSQRIQHSDKRLVESVCTIFSRLAENFQHDRDILKEIASHSVLSNMQQVLCVQPQLISSSIFVVVLHTMYIMCVNCTELATDLLHNNIADTLKYLLCGANMANKPTSHKVNYYKTDGIELIPRPPQELFEIVSLICEIMPKLPSTGEQFFVSVENISNRSFLYLKIRI